MEVKIENPILKKLWDWLLNYGLIKKWIMSKLINMVINFAENFRLNNLKEFEINGK